MELTFTVDKASMAAIRKLIREEIAAAEGNKDFPKEDPDTRKESSKLEDEVSLDSLRAALRVFVKVNGKDAAVNILKNFGVVSLSTLAQKDYAAALVSLDEIPF